MPTKTKFVASDEIEDLEFDFTKYGGPAGVIPEPSTGQIRDFRAAMSSLISEVSSLVPDDVEKMHMRQQLTLLAEFLNRDETEYAEKIELAIAAVCTDRPSFDDIHPLPYRVKQAFFGWITGVFLRPEASAPATTK